MTWAQIYKEIDGQNYFSCYRGMRRSMANRGYVKMGSKVLMQCPREGRAGGEPSLRNLVGPGIDIMYAEIDRHARKVLEQRKATGLTFPNRRAKDEKEWLWLYSHGEID